jgi:hypothetical protein
MAILSISKAWDETKAIAARDGRLLGAVALALVAFPSVVAGLVAPGGLLTQQPKSLWASVIVILASLIALAGQLALIRLALGPTITVAEAIGHGLRRMPIYLLAVLLVACGLVLAALPFGGVLAAAGVPLDGESLPATPVTILVGLVYLALICFVFVRLLMASPVASAERIGPIAIILRSWELSSGQWWRLFGFILVFLIGAAVIQLAIGATVGSVVVILLGPLKPLSASALLVSLVSAFVGAAITVLLMTMLARIYVQLARD